MWYFVFFFFLQTRGWSHTAVPDDFSHACCLQDGIQRRDRRPQALCRQVNGPANGAALLLGIRMEVSNKQRLPPNTRQLEHKEGGNVSYLMIGTAKINEHEIPGATAILVLELSFEHGQHLFVCCALRLRFSGGWVAGVPRRRCWRRRRRGLSGLGHRHLG